MDHISQHTQTTRKSTARNSREALIEEIASATTERNKPKLMRALAVASNTLKWSESDLHQLYQKRLDPKVKNYTALVWWHVKISATPVPPHSSNGDNATKKRGEQVI